MSCVCAIKLGKISNCIISSSELAVPFNALYHCLGYVFSKNFQRCQQCKNLRVLRRFKFKWELFHEWEILRPTEAPAAYKVCIGLRIGALSAVNRLKFVFITKLISKVKKFIKLHKIIFLMACDLMLVGSSEQSSSLLGLGLIYSNGICIR